MTMPEVYLVDGSAYIYRAFHAIKPLSNSKGMPTHAVFGFVAMLRKLQNERQPERLAVAFDTRGPVFRHRMYSEYKANRPPMPEDLAVQVASIRQVVRASGITMLEDEDQEADDLIASAAQALAAQGCRVVVVSGDKDLLQLVNTKITLWDPMKDQVMDSAAVETKYGIGPEQLVEYMALVGDSADNVPGVLGIGPKSATKLIGAYGSLEGIYASLQSMKASKMKERLIEHREMAFLSRELVRLNRNAEVPMEVDAYRITTPDQKALQALYTELEFTSLLKAEVTAGPPPTAGFHLVQTVDDLEVLAQRLAKADMLVLDTETDGLNVTVANLVGLSLATAVGEAWYLPIGHTDESGVPLPGQLPLAEVLRILSPLLNDAKLPKVGHNLKFDFAVLAARHNGGLRLAGPLWDTMIGAWLLDPGRRSLKLDDLCLEEGVRLTSFSEVVAGDKRPDAFCRVGLQQAVVYGCEDVYGAALLLDSQRPMLEEAGLWAHFFTVEGALIPVLANMEEAGIGVDGETLNVLAQEFASRLEEIEKDIYRAAGHTFNINSTQQLGTILFEELGLPRGKKTKTGYSTDVKVLEKLAPKHPLPSLVLSYRNLAKLKSTYVDKLAILQQAGGGRVHSSFNQCGTATGRLSSSNPNLQNIPIRTEEGRRIRSAFIAPPGSLLVAADYSQIDLRVLAHYSRDSALVEDFCQGRDIHRQTSAEIFSVNPALVTAEMRRIAKAINFGIIYGMSSFGLANQLGISRKEAQTFIDRYFSHYPGIRTFMAETIAAAREKGWIATLLGRRRMLPEITSANKVRREFAERIAINTPIQGTAADIIKLAMLEVDRQLAVRGLDARMVVQIHDELVLEVKENELTEVQQLLRTIMEEAVQLEVPLLVNVSTGQSLDKA